MLPITTFRAHIDALRNQRTGSGGRPTWTAVALYLVPFAAGVWSYVATWNLSSSVANLIGGFALIAGVLMAVFSLLAGWRRELENRASKRPSSESWARREVHAAVAHTLVGVWASVVAAIMVILLGALPAESSVEQLVNAGVAGLGVYIALLIMVIVNALHAGYEASIDLDLLERDKQERDQRSEV
ncbi:hypothetical protein [Ornithinimicrobium cerasi]|uniref:hypothetical protein n=1 Tax=Ornithinimicrobium cerasi TaxID=2248773 RepID=UPI001379B393|nr:hypothetical protein [Ornithinimicrobium cerasi]